MAASDANVFPSKNQAFRLPVSFRDSTGALITGWTGAASLVVADGASLGAGATPVEVGSTGLGYLDLTNVQMNGELIQVKCTVTNANALAFVQGIFTGGLLEVQSAVQATFDTPATEPSGPPSTLYQWLMLGMMVLTNNQVRTGAQIALHKRDGSTAATATVTDGEVDATRGAYQ